MIRKSGNQGTRKPNYKIPMSNQCQNFNDKFEKYSYVNYINNKRGGKL